MATQPLEIKGIARSKSKLAVDDGQAEDLINLRFKDGSWRTAGDGKRVYELNGVSYSNIFVHTSSYRHLIGYDGGSIYWFANIDEAGSISSIDRKALAEDIDSDGNILYYQLGHAIIFMTSKSRITLVFNEATEEYELKEKLDGDATNNYPIGNVDFRVTERSENGNPVLIHTKTRAKPCDTRGYLNIDKYNDSKIYATAGYNKILSKMLELSSYTGPFLACIAVKLITGKWTWASSPVLINPSLFGNTLHKAVKDPSTWQYEQRSGNYQYHYISDTLSPIYVIGDNHLQVTETIDVDYQIKKSQYRNSDNSISPRTVNVFGSDKTWRQEQEGELWHEYQTGTLSDFSELPVLFDTFMRPMGQTGSMESWIVEDSVEEHRVFGKLNDLEFKINELNIEEGGLYSSVGIFITPMLGNNGISFDVNDLSYNRDHTKSGTQHGGFDGLVNRIRMNIPCTLVGTGQSFDYMQNNSGLMSTWMPKHLFEEENHDGAVYDIEHAIFYKVKELSIDSLRRGEWVKVTLDEGILSNLRQQEALSIDAFNSSVFIKAKIGYSYNGRLHLANYKTTSRSIWGTDHLFEHDYTNEDRASGRILNDYRLSNISDAYSYPTSRTKELYDMYSAEYLGLFSLNFLKNGNILQDSVPIPTPTGVNPSYTEPLVLSSFVPYIDAGVQHIDSYINRIEVDSSLNVLLKSVTYRYEFPNEMLYYGIKFFISINGTPQYTDYKDKLIKPEDTGVTAIMKDLDLPNGLAVSDVDSPTFFPVEKTYKIGNGRIIALCSNAIAVGTGQTGAAPLYIFCTDGIYAMFVDDSGEMAYTNARIIARDVCNNAKSVTPIDAGVVFTTDRGLMMIAGEQVQEIGQIAEGDVLDYKTTPWAYKRTGEPIYVGNNMLTQIAKLPDEIVDGVNFLEFLRGSIINYNHNERELMVSNPDYPYTYILDQFGNWSRRNYSADEYVNNYPTSYRVVDGVFYKVDEEPNQLAGVSEAPNDLLYLSNIIKLGTTEFKSISRIVVRGKFDTNPVVIEDYVSKQINPVTHDVEIATLYTKEEQKCKLGRKYELYLKNRTSYNIRYYLFVEDANGDKTTYGDYIEVPMLGSKTVEITMPEQLSGGEIARLFMTAYYPSSVITVNTNIKITELGILGVYVLGSYDGTKFALMGGFENKGKFTDIGCKVERTDIKYLRVALAGHLSGDSRIDFIEMEGEGSNLNTKIR